MFYSFWDSLFHFIGLRSHDPKSWGLSLALFGIVLTLVLYWKQNHRRTQSNCVDTTDITSLKISGDRLHLSGGESRHPCGHSHPQPTVTDSQFD